MKQNQTNSSITFTGLLLLTFIILKLTHVINWSWLWVLAPAWMPLGLVISIMIIILIIKNVIKRRKTNVW